MRGVSSAEALLCYQKHTPITVLALAALSRQQLQTGHKDTYGKRLARKQCLHLSDRISAEELSVTAQHLATEHEQRRPDGVGHRRRVVGEHLRQARVRPPGRLAAEGRTVAGAASAAAVGQQGFCQELRMKRSRALTPGMSTSTSDDHGSLHLG